MAFSSIRKTTGFEIQTGDLRNPSVKEGLKEVVERRGRGVLSTIIIFLVPQPCSHQVWCNGRGKKGRPLPWVINYVTEN